MKQIIDREFQVAMEQPGVDSDLPTMEELEDFGIFYAVSVVWMGAFEEEWYVTNLLKAVQQAEVLTEYFAGEDMQVMVTEVYGDTLEPTSYYHSSFAAEALDD